jgi:hypothetical protein
MFSLTSPSYFLTPNYLGSAGTPLAVIDPATWRLLGTLRRPQRPSWQAF